MLAACSPPDYGTLLHFNNGELYYTSQITESEAVRLGNFLVDDGFFYGGKVTVQIDKEDNTYLFRMVTVEGTENDPTYLEEAAASTRVLSAEVFNGAPVDFHICDDRLQTRKVVPYIAGP